VNSPPRNKKRSSRLLGTLNTKEKCDALLKRFPINPPVRYKYYDLVEEKDETRRLENQLTFFKYVLYDRLRPFAVNPESSLTSLLSE